ncbi:endonuclease/exonuclease/phosphatase family protein [Yoonia vestfoldensis]|uniref:endonuclease/exonuclease/phosphatase family protein n=1 Tax=Yoonia vestfoldensis TaxID=245188 RepID=UPI00146EEC58|nr:hypothetical protein [Yoonia vestfoldensis]
MAKVPHNPQHLRLASYNIRKAKGVDGRYDTGRIVDILARLDTDVVAAKEAAIRAAVARDRRPTAILGDFNEWSPACGLEPLRADFTVHAPGKSFHAAMPMATVDRIALSRDIALTDGGVVQTPQSLRASDHLPIWGDVVIDRAA